MQKDNSGATFKNEKKEKETHPDFTGKCMVGGVEYWMSTWTNVYEKNGMKRKYFSHAFTPAEDAPKVKQKQSEDDEIPF